MSSSWIDESLSPCYYLTALHIYATSSKEVYLSLSSG